MKIFVAVKPNARRAAVAEIDATHFSVSVRERPEEGRANDAVRKALAKYFDIAPSRISLMSGGASRRKVFVIGI